MGKVNKTQTGYLKLAEMRSLPSTLGEYAGLSNIEAGLREKLGKDSLWLFAQEMYGITEYEGTVVDYIGMTEGIAVPVWYEGMRELTTIQDVDDYDRRTVTFPSLHESVVVFHIDENVEEIQEQQWSSGELLFFYSEVAVRLGQTVTILDRNEHKPNSLRWWKGKPELRILR